MKSISLAALAKRIGVGVATVDRVLNERGGVSPETTRRVLQAARDEIWASWRRACAENADHPRAKELFEIGGRFVRPLFAQGDPGGTDNAPLRGFEQSRGQVQQRGLAGAVRADDAAPSGVKIGVELPEERLGREIVAKGDIAKEKRHGTLQSVPVTGTRAGRPTSRNTETTGVRNATIPPHGREIARRSRRYRVCLRIVSE